MRGAAFIALALLVAPASAAQVVYPPPIAADVRSMDLTLDAAGAGTWDMTNSGALPPYAGVPDVTHLAQAVNTNDYLVCNYITRTTTTVSVRCLRINPLAGLLTGLFGGSLAGVKVNLIARRP